LKARKSFANHFYDIGCAISTDKGLFVPVIRDADQLSFAGVEKAIGAYAKKARDGKITLPDMEGGVFTITNGGVFGSLMSTPILQSAPVARFWECIQSRNGPWRFRAAWKFGP